MVKKFTQLIILSFCISMLSFTASAMEAEGDYGLQEENFKLKGRVQAVYMPGQLENLEDVCLTQINFKGKDFILIEDYYSCPYALRFKKLVNKQVTVVEALGAVTSGDPSDFATIQLQQLFPSAKLLFLEPL